jgi:hypothetical protein
MWSRQPNGKWAIRVAHHQFPIVPQQQEIDYNYREHNGVYYLRKIRNVLPVAYRQAEGVHLIPRRFTASA